MITLVAVSGTAANWTMGYQAENGFALTDPWLMMRGQCLGPSEGSHWFFQGVGYPAATFPMRPSYKAGIEEVVRLLLEVHPTGWFVLDGYSQGAEVVCTVWRDEILNPNGRLHYRLNDCLGIVTYGNPMRCPGIAYGNTLIARKPVPGKVDGYATGGISGANCLRPEECLFPYGHPLAGKAAVLDFANDGDIFASAPMGETPWISMPKVGHNMNLIYEAVMDFNGKDILAFAATLYSFATGPMKEFLPLVQAIWNGLRFLSQGMNAPHWKYDPWPATGYLDKLGRQYA